MEGELSRYRLSNTNINKSLSFGLVEIYKGH